MTSPYRTDGRTLDYYRVLDLGEMFELKVPVADWTKRYEYNFLNSEWEKVTAPNRLRSTTFKVWQPYMYNTTTREGAAWLYDEAMARVPSDFVSTLCITRVCALGSIDIAVVGSTAASPITSYTDPRPSFFPLPTLQPTAWARLLEEEPF